MREKYRTRGPSRQKPVSPCQSWNSAPKSDTIKNDPGPAFGPGFVSLGCSSMAERRTVNADVGGSSPPAPAEVLAAAVNDAIAASPLRHQQALIGYANERSCGLPIIGKDGDSRGHRHADWCIPG